MSHAIGEPQRPAGLLDVDVRERLEIDAKEIIARYPRSRSALLPLLHLVQAEEGFVSAAGIEFCADMLDLTSAEVAAVATFYTMYRRRPGGTYSVGVCTNTLCAVLGGDEIFTTLKEHLGVGHDETTDDGTITLEHLECNAACDYAPVMMVNWEFFDNQTPQSAIQLVDDLRAGNEVRPTRGPRLCTFAEVSRVLAGFADGLADEGPSAGPATLVGLKIARERGDTAPEPEAAERGSAAADAPSSQAQPAAEPPSKKAPAKRASARKKAAKPAAGASTGRAATAPTNQPATDPATKAAVKKAPVKKPTGQEAARPESGEDATASARVRTAGVESSSHDAGLDTAQSDADNSAAPAKDRE